MRLALRRHWPHTLRGRLRSVDRWKWVHRASDSMVSQLSGVTLALALLMLILGVLASARWQIVPNQSAAGSESRREAASLTIRRLEEEQSELKQLIGSLREQTAVSQEHATTEQSALADIRMEMERQKALAGMITLTGSGVRVILDDSAATTIPSQDEPGFYIVHEHQLRDVVNALWLAGAQGVAVNGERLVASTSVYCVGSTILVNDTRLSPPYEIVAIGDSAAMEQVISDPDNLKALKSRVRTYGLQLNVARLDETKLPAYQGTLPVKYAILGGEEADMREEWLIHRSKPSEK